MAGRPARFDDPEKLQEAVDAYFDFCGETGENYTLTGLALFLGYETRQSIYDQEERGDEFSYIIKKARLKVENNYELTLFTKNCTGAIFALKNMGWKDKSEIDNNHRFDQLPSINIVNATKGNTGD